MYWSVLECQETTKSGKRVGRKEQLDKSLLLTQEEEAFVFPPYEWKDFPANRSLHRDDRECCMAMRSNELQTNGCFMTNENFKESFKRS